MAVLSTGMMKFRAPLADSIDTCQLVNTLCLKPADNPLVSVIIPCYDQFHYTLQCLHSIQKFPPDIAIEVIVVDDASPCDDYSPLASVPGVTLLSNETNQGFIGSCNAGARIAKGEYLYFLNNDACLLRGAVDELVTSLRLFPQCGLVGSQLLYPNGKLQEAGAVLLADGTAINIGRFAEPIRSQYQYLRAVDYCSGASVMVRREQFLKLEGFDSYFAPAYYEDADLCMRYRELGLFTLYQPLSRVVHYEGISNGRSEHQGIKAYQAENHRKFHARWKDTLLSHALDNQTWDSSLPYGALGRVLLIANKIPRPDVDAGSICELNLMLLLRASGWQPVLFIEQAELDSSGYYELCQGLGIELVYPTHFLGLRSLLSKRGNSFDLVILFRPETCHERLPLVRRLCANAKIVYYPHDLHYLRFEREADVLGKPEYLKRSAQYRIVEQLNSLHCDLTILLSEDEQRILRSNLPEVSLATLPLVLADGPKHAFHSDQECFRNIVFIGNFNHSPNYDAVRFFVDEVFPLIIDAAPDAIFHVVGSSPPPDILALDSSSIRVHGFVEDLDQLLSEMDVSVLPLRFGAGVKGKLGVSLRAGVPVVSTRLGVEGVPVVEDTHALLADHPEAFANAVLALFSDPELRLSLRTAGQRMFTEQWGVRHAYFQLYDILSRLGLSAHSEPIQDPIPLLPLPRPDWPGSHSKS